MAEETAEKIENSVLGALLLMGEEDQDFERESFGKCLNTGVSAEWFTDPGRKRMWEAMAALHAKGAALDSLTVADRMGDGAADAIEAAIGETPTTANFEYYLGMLLERRVYVEYHRWLMRELKELRPNMAKIRVEGAVKRIAELQTLAKGCGDTLHEISDYVEGIVEEKRWLCEERFVKRNWGKYRGVPLPWGQLNMIYKGLKTGLHIWAALASQGKTTLAVNVSNYWAARGIRHGFVCMDMPADALAERYAAVRAQLSISKLDFGASPAYVGEFERAMREVAGERMVHITESDQISQLEYEITRGVKSLGWKTCIVDYLQLVDPEMKGATAPYVLVKEATVRMKKLAKRLRIPIVCLVQLSNQFAKDRETGSKKPRLDHLGDSSEIGRAARSVAVMYRDDDVAEYWKQYMPGQLMYFDPKGRLRGADAERGAEASREWGQANIIASGGLRPVWLSVIKNQQGGTGDVPFVMYAKYFMLRPGDMEAKSEKVELGGKVKTVAAAQFGTIRDDWLFNAGDEILERTGGIGTRWVRYPGETMRQYAERVVAERRRHGSNSGMWDEALAGDGSNGIRIGLAEYGCAPQMAVEKVTEEELG